MIVKQALLAFALAFLAESMTEYLFAPWVDALVARFPGLGQPLKYVSVCVGVGMAFAYSLDLLNVVFEMAANPPWVGILLTGMAIGRGSNYVHDLWSKYLKPQA